MILPEAVIFDLDGVVVSTDEYHYQAWSRLAVDEELFFSRQLNDQLRGVSRQESLRVILSVNGVVLPEARQQVLCHRKNRYYLELITQLRPSDILPGVPELLQWLRDKRIRIGLGSSSRNARTILDRIGLEGSFEVIVDGNDVSRSKPDPEVFLKVAEKLGVEPSKSLVIEDSIAGVDAAIAGGMWSYAVGSATTYSRAHFRVKDLSSGCLDGLGHG